MTIESREKHPQAWALIDALPHRQHIKDEHAVRWIDRVTEWLDQGKFSSFSMAQHIQRCATIGGSEIASVLNHYRGDHSVFKSATQLALEKLMVFAPQPSLGIMQRGNDLEPIIRQKFIDQFQPVAVLTDHPAVREACVAKDQLPWTACSPDEVVAIRNGNRLIRLIVDYKSPNPGSYDDPSEPVPFDYQCQLELYTAKLEANRHILEGAGLVKPGEAFIHGKLLFPWDLVKWEASPRIVPIDLVLREEMLDAGQRFMNEYIMEGRVPEILKRAEFSGFTPEHNAELAAAAERYAFWKQVETHAKEQYSEAAKTMEGIANAYNLDAMKASFGAAGLSGKYVASPEKIELAAMQAGVNLEAFLTAGKKPKLDPEVVADKLSLHGVDPESLYVKTIDYDAAAQHLHDTYGIDPISMATQEVAVSLTRAKKGTEREHLDALAISATQQLSQIIPAPVSGDAELTNQAPRHEEAAEI